MSDKQKTLKAPFSMHGTGLHTGLKVIMNVLPAPADTGIVFRRTDLPEKPEIPALAEFVSDTSRSTTVEKNGVKVSTIEHLMAALWYMGVDNAYVEVDAPEVPIMDGSARQYVEKISEIGLQEQEADIKYYEITEKVKYTIPEKNVEIEILPDNDFSVSVLIDYNSKVLGNQYATLDQDTDFASEVAPCRTFVFFHELAQLLAANLIKGGDVDNAIVVVEEDTSQEEIYRVSKLFPGRNVKVEGGYLDNIALRFPNEPARHKLLDVLGDFALLGMRIKGRVLAMRPGHKANTEIIKQLRKIIRKEGPKPQYKYDPAKEPVYDIKGIMGLLPHRPPFLLVDRIIHIDADSVAGIKNVTMNEPFFVGHFPSEPVMPGVLIVEAMAQCGGILALHGVEDPENYSTYFLKIDNVRFKQKVVPGDTLQFELKLTEPVRRGIVQMSAKAFVGGQLATEAFLMAQVIRNKA